MSKKKTVTTKTLSALVFCLGAGSTAQAAAPAVSIQSLELRDEAKISYDEFHALVSKGDFLNESNYSDFVNAGNYANFLNEANYADFVNAGNYANFINAGNYGSVGEGKDNSELPSPQVSL